jgi:DNA-binding NarL/FixJ family response regulator
MQMIESDLVDAERVFGNLREAREHFGIVDERSDLAANHTAAVQRLKGLGLTQKRIAAELGIDVRTVKRHWKSSDPT